MVQQVTAQDLSQKYDIAQLRMELQKKNTNSRIIDILKTLQTKDISKKILKETQIGKKIGSLREHQDSQVSKLAKILVSKWKEQINSQKLSNKKKQQVYQQTNNHLYPERSHPKHELKIQNKVVYLKKKSNKTVTRTKSNPLKNKNWKRSRKMTNLSKLEIKNEIPLENQSLKHYQNKETNLVKMFNFKTLPFELQCFQRMNVIALWEKFPSANILQSSKNYLSKAKSLLFNIKNPPNNQLRLNLLKGIIKPKELIEMDAKQMASSQMKKIREEKEMSMFEARRMDWGRGNTKKKGMFKCFKCKSQNTQYSQMQTRSGDQPMTTFIQCLDCGNRWKC